MRKWVAAASVGLLLAMVTVVLLHRALARAGIELATQVTAAEGALEGYDDELAAVERLEAGRTTLRMRLDVTRALAERRLDPELVRSFLDRLQTAAVTTQIVSWKGREVQVALGAKAPLTIVRLAEDWARMEHLTGVEIRRLQDPESGADYLISARWQPPIPEDES